MRLVLLLRSITNPLRHRLPELEISLFLLRRLLGVRTEDKKQTKVSKLTKNELLLINIGSTSTGGRVLSVKGDLAKIQLTSPACTEVGEKVALSRRIEKHWRLVGALVSCLPFSVSLSCMYACESVADPPSDRLGKCTTGYGIGARLIRAMYRVQCPCRAATPSVDHASMLYSSACTKGVLITCGDPHQRRPPSGCEGRYWRGEVLRQFLTCGPKPMVATS